MNCIISPSIWTVWKRDVVVMICWPTTIDRWSIKIMRVMHRVLYIGENAFYCSMNTQVHNQRNWQQRALALNQNPHNKVLSSKDRGKPSLLPNANCSLTQVVYTFNFATGSAIDRLNKQAKWMRSLLTDVILHSIYKTSEGHRRTNAFFNSSPTPTHTHKHHRHLPHSKRTHLSLVKTQFRERERERVLDSITRKW